MTRLKAMLISKKIKPAELARRLKVSRSCIFYAERDGLHTVAAALRYAEALECQPHDLLEIPNLRSE